MNVFIISPGRTATTSLSHTFSHLNQHTSGHETRTKFLGDDRVKFDENHVECDNRLAWFMPRLTAKYNQTGLLIIVRRDVQKIAKSYDKRWYKINITKAYSQGILMRDLEENSVEVCADFATNIYEQLDFAAGSWTHVVELDLEAPEEGLRQALSIIGQPEKLDDMLKTMQDVQSNQNVLTLRDRASILKFSLKNLLWDVRQCFQ